ncbi:MAG: glycyl-radical enzyme activating protein [Eubacteriales bacterium]|jgi:pyruvate formate lyase activating enzyme|nr:glycyl-radical enzyme activating protein [Eubacteriales bacterium]
MSEAVIFNIERASLHDGPGVRTVVYVKGCSLNCKWCHNPEGISPFPQLLRYETRCIGCGRCAAVCPDPARCSQCGKCAAVCPAEARLMCGRTMTSDEVFAHVSRDRHYYGTDGGLTLSGGECLTNPDFCADLLRRCRGSGIHTAIESALFVPRAAVDAVLPWCDLFIADMKIADTEDHRRSTGAPNTLIKANLEYLFEYAVRHKVPKIWIRTPLIPGETDGAENLAAIEDFLEPWKDSGIIEKREMLEYNNLGEAKRRALESGTDKS